MQIVGRGRMFLGTDGSEVASACFPGVCVLPGGRWLTAFRTSPRKANALPQRVRLSWSDNAGQTWTAPVDPYVKQRHDGKIGGWRAGQPTALGGARVAMTLYWVDESRPGLPFFNEKTEGLLDSRLAWLARAGRSRRGIRTRPPVAAAAGCRGDHRPSRGSGCARGPTARPSAAPRACGLLIESPPDRPACGTRCPTGPRRAGREASPLVSLPPSPPVCTLPCPLTDRRRFARMCQDTRSRLGATPR